MSNKKITFTHLWVDEFGWENTIYLYSDFEYVELLGESEKDGKVYMCEFKNGKHSILKGYERS